MKDCSPDDRLINYLDRKLRLIEASRKRQLTHDEKKEEKRLNEEKSRVILDKVIFPSLSNLIYFFETLADSEEMRRLFDDDAMDLFGTSQTEEDNAKEQVTTRDNNLARLVAAILIPDFEYTKNEQIKEDFRLRLLHDLQDVIRIKTIIAISQAYPKTMMAESFAEDMEKALGCTHFLNSMAKLDEQTKHRTLQLSTRSCLDLKVSPQLQDLCYSEYSGLTR